MLLYVVCFYTLQPFWQAARITDDLNIKYCIKLNSCQKEVIRITKYVFALVFDSLSLFDIPLQRNIFTKKILLLFLLKTYFLILWQYKNTLSSQNTLSYVSYHNILFLNCKNISFICKVVFLLPRYLCLKLKDHKNMRMMLYCYKKTFFKRLYCWLPLIHKFQMVMWIFQVSFKKHMCRICLYLQYISKQSC